MPAQAVTQSSDDDGNIAPIAGVAALGLLAISGAAFALRRKRREDDADEFADLPAVTSPDAGAAPQPAPAARPRVADPVTPAAAELPAGFDVSRFGRHTQAAYRGPTPDNPSLSLKRRLSRASFMDRRERLAGGAVPARTPQPEAPVSQRRPDNGQITVRLAPARFSPRFSYGFQR